MALFEDVFKGGNIATAAVVTVGAAVLAPIMGPLVRPLAKSAIKAGLVAYDQGRVLLADLSERTGDIVAEAREELEHEATESKAEVADKMSSTGQA